METNTFKYPIFPDRVYTIKSDVVNYNVSGSLLIKAYLKYVKDSELSTENDSY